MPQVDAFLAFLSTNYVTQLLSGTNTVIRNDGTNNHVDISPLTFDAYGAALNATNNLGALAFSNRLAYASLDGTPTSATNLTGNALNQVTNAVVGIISEVDISLSPYNVTNDGVTDNTFAITNALSKLAAKGQGAYLPGGTYFTKPFTMYSGQSLRGGVGAKLLFQTNSIGVAVNMDYNSPNISIDGFEIDGGNPNNIPTADDGRVGLLVFNIHQPGWRVGNIYAHGFGRGIELYAAYSVTPSEINLFNCIAKHNFIGLSVLSGADYLAVYGIESTANYFGIYLEAGNDNFYGCNFSMNRVGLNMAANGSHAHGSFTGCSFNHCELQSLVATNQILGETFQGCTFLPPNITLTNCQGITFSSCLIGWSVMTNANGATNTITFDHSTNCSILFPANPYLGVGTITGYLVVSTNSSNIQVQDGINWNGNFTGNLSGSTNYSADALNNATGHAATMTNAANAFTGTFNGNGSNITGVNVADTNITGTIFVDPVTHFVGIGTNQPPSASEFDGLRIVTKQITNSVGRAIKAELHFAGDYGATALEDQTYIEGTNTMSHLNGIQSWMNENATAIVGDVRSFYATKTLTAGVWTKYVGYYYTTGIGNAVNNYAFFSQGQDPSFFDGYIGISDVVLKQADMKYSLFVQRPFAAGSYGVTTAQAGIYSDSTVAVGDGGCLVLGGKSGQGSDPYPNVYLLGARESLSTYAGYFAIYCTSGGDAGGVNSANYERFRVTSTGHVLINTTNDNGGQLQVNGTVTGNGSGLTNLPIVTTFNAPVAVTVGASSFLFTNTTPTDLRCFVSGGAATVSVGLNGVTVAASLAALDYSVIIGPTEYITLIYSIGTPALYTNKFGR